MRKLTECLIVLAFLLCAFTAQAASEIDVAVPSAGEPCSNDLQCDPGEVCVNDICSATRPCSNDLQCDSGELCVDGICQEGECETDEDCDEGLVCDNSANVCVECLRSSDCQEGEFCVDNTCIQSGDCELIINPPRININRKKSPPWVRKKFTVKGNENFDPNGEISVDDPLFVWNNTIRRQRNQLEFIIEVTLDPMPDEGFYQISVGNCVGEVELYDKKAAKAAE